MKISFDMASLVEALDLVSIVPPKTTGAAGYLFVVKGDKCYVYSRDNACVVRGQFPLRESDGDGSFVYPAEYVGALKILASTSDTCEIEATQEDEKYTVRYRASSGAKAERGSFDPRILETCDQDLEESEESSSFSPGLLREAIAQAKPFISKQDGAEECFKGLQILDSTKPEYAKGNGTLYVSDGTRAFYFRCSAFLDKSLDIHGQHLGQFVNFLGAALGDAITLRKGKHFTFAIDKSGNVFGWPKHSKGSLKFGYYNLTSDQYVLSFPKARILNSLQHIKSELDAKDDKIKVSFDPERRVLLFEVAAGSAKVNGIPTQVTIKQADTKPWTFQVDVNQMLELVNSLKGHEVELRVRVVPASGDRRSDLAMFRTIESFNVDASGKVVVEATGAFECQVTRFMPSKG